MRCGIEIRLFRIPVEIRSSGSWIYTVDRIVRLILCNICKRSRTVYSIQAAGYLDSHFHERHYRPIFPYQSPLTIARNSAICPVIICSEYFRLDIFFTIFFLFSALPPITPNLVVESLSRRIQLLIDSPRHLCVFSSSFLFRSLTASNRIASGQRIIIHLRNFPKQSSRLTVPDLPSRLVSYPEPSIVMVNTLRDCSGHPNR